MNAEMIAFRRMLHSQPELSGQEIRQIQLVEAVASRYDDRRQALPAISRSP